MNTIMLRKNLLLYIYDEIVLVHQRKLILIVVENQDKFFTHTHI